MADLISALLLAMVLAVLALAFLGGYRLGLRKARTRIVVAAKRVDNRVMPGYSRAERRAHKRRAR